MSSNREAKTVTVRPAANALLAVDSNDSRVFDKTTGVRIDISNPSQIYINKQRPLLTGYLTRLALTEMNINWATPNVNQRNNTLTMAVQSSSGVRYGRLTIPEGFYKPTELATAIMAQFISVFGTFLNYTAPGNPLFVSFSTVTSSFTLEAQSSSGPGSWDNFTFSILPGIKYMANPPTIPTALPAVQDDLTEMMGLTPTSETVGTTELIVNGGFATMMYTPYIDVVSNLLTKNQNVADGDSAKIYTSSKLARIYFSNESIEARTEDNIPGVRPFVCRREFVTPKQIQWDNTENVDAIDIQVLDHKGRPIYITPSIINVSGSEITIGNQANIQFTILVIES